MNITIRGIDAEIDINDDDSILAACDALSAASLKRINPNDHTKALRRLMQGLHYWTVKNGAMLYAAAVTGAPGIGMNGAQQSHNFIAALLGEPPISLPNPEEEEEAGPNEHLEGDEDAEPATILDEEGRPIVLPETKDEL